MKNVVTDLRAFGFHFFSISNVNSDIEDVNLEKSDAAGDWEADLSFQNGLRCHVVISNFQRLSVHNGSSESLHEKTTCTALERRQASAWWQRVIQT